MQIEAEATEWVNNEVNSAQIYIHTMQSLTNGHDVQFFFFFEPSTFFKIFSWSLDILYPPALEQNPTSARLYGKFICNVAVNTAANSLGDRPGIKYFSVTQESMLTVVKKFYKNKTTYQYDELN